MSKQQTSKPSFWRYENFIVILMFLVYGFVMMDRFSVMYLFPFIVPALKLDNAQVGLIVSVLAICWGISSYVFSTLSDVMGNKKKFLIFIVLLFSAASISSGLAPTFMALIMARGLMGISEGPVITLSQATVVAESTPSRRGFNVGFVQSATALLGTTLGPIIVIAVANAFNWRTAFYLLGVPSIILAIVLMLFMKEPNMSAGLHGEGHVKPTFSEYIKVFKERNVWVGMILSIGFMTWLFSTSAFLTLYLTEVDKFSPSRVSLFLGIYGLANFLSQLLIPWVSDRIGRKPAMIIASVFQVFLTLSILELHTYWALFIVACLIMLGTGYAPIFMAVIPAESVSKPVVATAMSLIVLVGEVFGGTIAPSIAGVMADKYSLAAPMWLAVCGSILVLLFSFGLKETAPQKIKKLGSSSVTDAV